MRLSRVFVLIIAGLCLGKAAMAEWEYFDRVDEKAASGDIGSTTHLDLTAATQGSLRQWDSLLPT